MNVPIAAEIASLGFDSRHIDAHLTNGETIFRTSVGNMDRIGTRHEVFGGGHPLFTYAPPNLMRSIIAMVLPAPPNRAARDGPA